MDVLGCSLVHLAAVGQFDGALGGLQFDCVHGGRSGSVDGEVVGLAL